MNRSKVDNSPTPEGSRITIRDNKINPQKQNPEPRVILNELALIFENMWIIILFLNTFVPKLEASLREFGTRSSIHGISYFFDSKRHWVERWSFENSVWHRNFVIFNFWNSDLFLKCFQIMVGNRIRAVSRIVRAFNLYCLAKMEGESSDCVIQVIISNSLSINWKLHYSMNDSDIICESFVIISH